MLFAHSLEQRMNGNSVGRIAYDRIELNVPMDDSIFKMPVKETPPAPAKKDS